MKINVGTLERWMRVLIGAVLVTLVFVGPHSAWGWFGLLPMATGLVGNCPLYSVLRFSTTTKSNPV